MTDYSNILKATQGQQTGLTAAQQADNYEAFSNLMKEGVYLPDLVKKVQEVDSLKKRLDEMEKKSSPMDEDLFLVMESAVKDDPDVKAARARMSDAKTLALRDLCMKDPAFASAYEDYRKTVNRAYVAKRG